MPVKKKTKKIKDKKEKAPKPKEEMDWENGGILIK